MERLEKAAEREPLVQADRTDRMVRGRACVAAGAMAMMAKRDVPAKLGEMARLAVVAASMRSG
ncbi:hypothetical protein E5554_10520 [Sphingobium sp. PAMC28499]|nr:hypothetical protein E5554_10520 [Sphingobium sp. PAMC28499]